MSSTHNGRLANQEMAKLVYAMITENTGRHFLDTGGETGRQWQHNRGRTLGDFMRDPPLVVKWNPHGCFNCTVSTFHLLRSALGAVRPELAEDFQQWCEGMDDMCVNDLRALKQWLHVRQCTDVRSAYTYNEENALSQDFVYCVFRTSGGDELVAISTHNGCDARGGFSTYRFFVYPAETDGAAPRLESHACFTLLARNTGDTVSPVLPTLGEPGDFDNAHGWETDDAGATWNDAQVGRTRVEPLQEYEVTMDPQMRGRGKMYVSEAGTIYSPVNGVRLVPCWS